MRRDQSELIGEKYGMLTVIGNFQYRPEGKLGKRRLWCDWRCECGKEKKIRWKDVRSGKTKSCGCLAQSSNPRQWTKAKSPQERTYRSIYKRHVTNSKQRSIKYLEYTAWRRIVINDCYYCGEKPPILNVYNEPSVRAKWKGPDNEIPKYDASINGVDRFLPIPTYEGNSVPCCKICNVMKGQLDPVEFIQHIERILQKNNETAPYVRLSENYWDKFLDITESNFSGRTVFQLDNKDQIIRSWDTVRECAKDLVSEIGGNLSSIERGVGKVCRGEKTSYKNLKFKYNHGPSN